MLCPGYFLVHYKKGSVAGVLSSLFFFSYVNLVTIGDHFYCCVHRKVFERECIYFLFFDPVLLVGVCGFY